MELETLKKELIRVRDLLTQAEEKGRKMSLVLDGEFGKTKRRNPLGLYHSLEMGREYYSEAPGANQMLQMYRDVL